MCPCKRKHTVGPDEKGGGAKDEDLRVKTFEDVSPSDLPAWIQADTTYHVLGTDRRIAITVDGANAAALAYHGLIRGTVRVRGDVRTLSSVSLVQGVTPSMVRATISLRPANASICNQATVVEVGPSNYWHRACLDLLKCQPPRHAGATAATSPIAASVPIDRRG